MKTSVLSPSVPQHDEPGQAPGLEPAAAIVRLAEVPGDAQTQQVSQVACVAEIAAMLESGKQLFDMATPFVQGIRQGGGVEFAPVHPL